MSASILLLCAFGGFVVLAMVVVVILVLRKRSSTGSGATPSSTSSSSVATWVSNAEKSLTTNENDYLGELSSGSAWNAHENGMQWWTAGFMIGCWWKMYALTQKESWKKLAEKMLPRLAEWQTRTNTHDVGFVMMAAYGNAPSPDAGALVKSARNLAARYSPKRKLLRSWGENKLGDNNFTVIVDNLMNLKLLWEAAKLSGGQASWKDIAKQHALTSIQLFVRPNGSTYHKIIFSSADVKPGFRGTHQGLTNESTWSRGQAWAMYGFCDAFAYTGDVKFRDVAEKCASYFLDNLPADNVPLWDFQATDAQKDTSAASIGACALFKLSKHTSNAKYADRARAILSSLDASFSGTAKGLKSILCCGVASNNKDRRRGVNVGLVYGDYYFLEALQLAQSA